MKYTELKNLKEQWDKKVCIFGAGLIGCTWAYDLLLSMGFHIDFYCDNMKKAKTVIRDGVEIAPLHYLYSLKEDVLVFLTVSEAYQKSVRKQLKEQGVYNIIGIGSELFKQTFIESLLKMNDQRINSEFECILDDKEYISRRFEYHMGYRPNLKNPRTFNEKLQWLKIYDRDPRYTQMVDKYEMKKYIGDKAGAQYVVPTLGIYNSFKEIDFNIFPEQFVLKCTHDSGSIVVCKDKQHFHAEDVKDFFETHLKYNYYWIGREWPYKHVKPRIIAEEYLEDKQDGELRDYKFFCFHGVAKVMLIAQGRMSSRTETTTDFYNEKLEHIDMQSGHANALVRPHMPQNYSKMKEIAEKLSAGLRHLRVDFYEVKGKIYVGELTFFHQGGMVPLEPYAMDVELGSWINLE